MLTKHFNAYITKYIERWDLIDGRDAFPSINPWYKRQHRYLKIRYQLKRVLKRIAKEDLSSHPLDLSRFKNDFQIGRLLDSWLQFDVWHMDQSQDGDYVKTTEDFITRARELWPEMPSTDIFQALRNVWIMIAIQMIAKVPVILTDAMFAYSMLYPLTDNVIDHPNLTQDEKALFVSRLGLRLLGTNLEPISKYEPDVFSMVSLIESTFDRAQFPDVYTSVLLIHDAQKRSLTQQYGTLNENELIKLSFEKGAASVVADGYLVLGSLTTNFLEFLTAYGIVLQLADDLQDIEIDTLNNHMTLFNITTNSERLAVITENLSSISFEILEKIPTDDAQIKMQMTALLGKSMQILICDAVHTHKKRYSKVFYKRVNQSHITGLKNHNRLKRLAQSVIESKFGRQQ